MWFGGAFWLVAPRGKLCMFDILVDPVNNPSGSDVSLFELPMLISGKPVHSNGECGEEEERAHLVLKGLHAHQ